MSLTNFVIALKSSSKDSYCFRSVVILSLCSQIFYACEPYCPNTGTRNINKYNRNNQKITCKIFRNLPVPYYYRSKSTEVYCSIFQNMQYNWCQIDCRTMILDYVDIVEIDIIILVHCLSNTMTSVVIFRQLEAILRLILLLA